MKRLGKITSQTRKYVAMQTMAQKAAAFGAPKPEDRMKFFNRRSLGHGRR